MADSLNCLSNWEPAKLKRHNTFYDYVFFASLTSDSVHT